MYFKLLVTKLIEKHTFKGTGIETYHDFKLHFAMQIIQKYTKVNVKNCKESFEIVSAAIMVQYKNKNVFLIYIL